MSLILLGVAAAMLVAPAPQASPTPAPPLPEPSPAASVEELYRTILPAPIGDEEAAAGHDSGTQASENASVSRDDRLRDDSGRDALHFGSVFLTPRLRLFFVDAEGALLDTAEPVEDTYYEIRPEVGAELPVGTGALRAAYEARIRRGSSFALVGSTVTHLADLSLNLPFGGVGELLAAEHFAHGVLETAEVDPGREYFFQLGRFTRHRHNLGLRLLPGGRVDGTVAGSLDVIRVDDRAAFFDHEEQIASAQIGYEMRPAVRAAVGYAYRRIPFTIERPQVESRIHSAYGEVRGELLPLTDGNVTVGYFSQTSPHAGPGGTRFAGLSYSGRLEKSFTPSSSLTLRGARGTHPSSFEQNAFYLSSSVEVVLRAGLPLSLALEAGAGYHRNNYRTVASSIGAPRRDDIRGFTLGLARPVTRHAYVRADYRRDRRNSNLDVFDSHTNVLTVELAVGVFASGTR